jgi:hypothetical protein
MITRRVIALPLVVLVSGCDLAGRIKGWGGAFGEGAAEKGTAVLQGKPAEDAITKVTSTSAAAIADAYKQSLSPVIAAELDRFRSGAQTTLAAERESLAVSVREKWASAAEAAVQRNLRSAGSEARSQETLFLKRVPDDYARYVAPVLANAIASSTDTALARVATALDTRLNKSAEDLVSRAVSAGVTAGLRAAQQSPVWTTSVRLAIGAIIAVLVLALAWVSRRHVMARNALRAVADVIDRSGNAEVKSAVRASAADRRVDKYLNSYFTPRPT